MAQGTGWPASSPDEIERRLAGFRSGDAPTHGGRTFAYVYDSGLADLDDVAARAHRAFAPVNCLDPTVFPSVAALENGVVGIAAGLLGGGPQTAGVVTSGGTESCLLAVLAAREEYRARGGTGTPQIVAATTSHAAFRKGAHLFGLEVVDVDVDPANSRVAVADLVAAFTDRTAIVVASAPSYPMGVFDPVAEVAPLAAERGVWVHVDACIGGWVTPYLQRAGEPIPPCDLSAPGVRSLSVDLHKYGYAPKGASVLLFVDAASRRRAYFSSSYWPGYPVVNSTLQSTKSAGPLAAAWATLNLIGDEGYAELARKAREATLALAKGAVAIEGLRLAAPPETTLVAVATDDPALDVYVVADEMAARGWYVQPQPAYRGLPATLHLTVTAASLPRVEPFLADLSAAVAAAKALPLPEVDPMLLAAAKAIDPDALTAEQMDAVLGLAGFGTGDGGPALPERMAPVLTLLQALPPTLRDRMLEEFFSRIFTARTG